MTSIKEVIEIALNVGFLNPRYTVKEVILNKDFVIEVYYYDNLCFDNDFIFDCEFSL